MGLREISDIGHWLLSKSTCDMGTPLKGPKLLLHNWDCNPPMESPEILNSVSYLKTVLQECLSVASHQESPRGDMNVLPGSKKLPSMHMSEDD